MEGTQGARLPAPPPPPPAPPGPPAPASPCCRDPGRPNTSVQGRKLLPAQCIVGPPMEEFPVGTCQAMCPPAERARREHQGRLHRLEEEDGAVKEYSRPAAGKPRPLPEELRPPAVLLATVRHLLGCVESQAATAVAPAEGYDFITDRLRAVRLDAALQGLRGAPYATLLERVAAYLLHAGYCLGAQPPALWDPHLHRAQLQETFAGLRRCYREPGPHRAQPLFQACFLLCNLGSSEALRETLDLPAPLRGSPELRTALDIHWAFLERDWARFFRRARGLSYLASCALHPHVAPARRQALLTLSHGFNSRRGHFPLERLARLLAAEGEGEVAELCEAHGLRVEGAAVIFQKAAYKDPGVLEHRPSWELVEGKRGEGSLLELVEGVCS